MMRSINSVDNSTNRVLETKIKLATVKESFNIEHKALSLYDTVDENSPYSVNNLSHGIIIDTLA